ncbi:MAG TPA: hypothetical protein DEB70_06855 [Planctomycetaceae bacterium]|nr:hypothetical protein [Planctomycetaceae bacterium]
MEARRNNPRHPPAGVAGRPILPLIKFDKKASSQNKTVKQHRGFGGFLSSGAEAGVPSQQCQSVHRRIKSAKFAAKSKAVTALQSQIPYKEGPGVFST